MARERSRVHKRRRGCLTGCLTNLLLLLGLAALLFVGACVLGIVRNDPETGKPYLSFESVGLSGVTLPELGLPELDLPAWAYRVNASGLTVKTLRAGQGEAVLVCSDGYTMLLGAGSGTGVLMSAQLLLSGVSHLHAAVAPQSSDAQLGAMKLVMPLMKPDYLLYTDTQVKSSAFGAMLDAADRQSTQCIAAEKGLSFSLGRATVTVVGPAVRHHTQERDDGLSVRIDYGNTSVLVLGGITSTGERELASSGVNLDVDVLIADGAEDTACLALVEAATPSVALLTGKSPANPVRVRLQKAGAQVLTASENGVMTVFSDGQSVSVQP